MDGDVRARGVRKREAIGIGGEGRTEATAAPAIIALAPLYSTSRLYWDWDHHHPRASTMARQGRTARCHVGGPPAGSTQSEEPQVNADGVRSRQSFEREADQVNHGQSGPPGERHPFRSLGTHGHVENWAVSFFTLLSRGLREIEVNFNLYGRLNTCIHSLAARNHPMQELSSSSCNLF